ncbi:MAG: LysM peptidoglycan-binding domain-containing protein [Ferruginibacter sp.]|nr:LysM peptidoglycan-binding domain-containing protein [Ferruginibacter sp.]
MKKIVLILFLLPIFVQAQKGIMVEGTQGNLYLNHIAAAKENFYSIGRLYNISPKDIAPYNKLNLENGLTIGQSVKVPLQEVNFTQSNKVAADEAAVPLYHKVEAKETLFQLSSHFNKVPVSFLKAWNNLKDDAVTPGKNIIVGYLKVKKDLSAYAQMGTKIPTEKVSIAAVKEVPVKKEEPVKEIAKETPKPKKEEVVKSIAEPVAEIKKVEEAKVKKEMPVKTSNINISTDLKTGVFKSYFLNSGNEEKGTAGVFKSTSGWEDGKYYCLQNTASQGAIVKITNPSNGKYIYAKVLDSMPELKQNDNLAIRISNAAADALGAGLANFECEINY